MGPTSAKAVSSGSSWAGKSPAAMPSGRGRRDILVPLVASSCSDEHQHHRPAAKRRLKHSTSPIDDEFDLVVLARRELGSVLDETSNGELRTPVVNSCHVHNAA